METRASQSNRQIAPMIVRLLALAALGIQLIAGLALAQPAAAVEPAPPHFERTWARVDLPVLDGLSDRTWLWGPDANTAVLTEPYAESPDGMREVQYYDKSRMEINNPDDGDPSSPWYVTNGLLVVELMTGRMQVGDTEFVERLPSENIVAGDQGDPNGPTYQTFASLRDLPPLADGATITQRVDRAGNVTDDPALASFGVTTGYHVTEPGIDHQVAQPFWEFMNSSGLIYDQAAGFVEDNLFQSPFYATGLPVTEAYWATVEVAGTPKDVLTQCFERRCLTYTPDNAPGWQVEAGNVGQHYYAWRTDSAYDGDDMPPPPADADAMRINEILYLPGEEMTTTWLELFNPAGVGVDLSGWRLATGDGAATVELPGWTLVPGAYLTVYFGNGDNDADSSDGSAAFYAGEADAFAFFFDVGLYGSAEGVDSIIDFVAWGYGADYTGGAVQADAVAAGIWIDGAAYNVNGGVAPDEIEPHERRHTVGPDESIGRDAAATDSNTPADWAAFGGADALDPTPGARNESVFLSDYNALVDAPQEQRALQQALDLPQPAKSWTILVYNDHRDGNISKQLIDELREMRTVGSNADVNIVVRNHHSAGVAATIYVADGRYELLRRDTNVNPGTSQALSSFINYAKANFPAERYAIVFGGHGNGWKALFPYREQDFLRMSELSAGLAALGQKFDVVKFDACLMAQVEVAHQIEPQARMMVASEQISWGGFPWASFMKELQNDPSMDGGTVADRLAQLHTLAYERILSWLALDILEAEGDEADELRKIEHERRAYTWSVIDTSVVSGQVVPAVTAFATALIEDIEMIEIHDFRDDNHQLVIKHDARELVMEYDDSNFIDLQRFAELVRFTLLEASDLARPVIDGVEAAVRWESHGPTATYEQSHGLSIYFPRTLLHPDYWNGRQNRPAGGAELPSSCLAMTPLCGDARAFDDPKGDPTLPGRTHLYKLDAAIKLPSLAGEPHAMRDDPGFSFPNDSTWDEFLHRYYKPVADACVRIGNNCLPEASVEVGQTVELSANGSSDSDGSIGPLDDEPGLVDYYWDFDPSQDNPNPLPNYRPNVRFFACTDAENQNEDCDRDEIDETDDDADAVGKLVPFTCAAPGEYPIRLMVWDEHHRQSREAYEERAHNDGRHWLHFNVDDAEVVIRCGDPDELEEPIKRADKAEAGQGEEIEYTIIVPANPGLTGPSPASILDDLPDVVEFGSISECAGGTCGYDAAQHQVTLSDATLDAGHQLLLRFTVVIAQASEVEFPPEIVNCATVNDGLFLEEVCATTTLMSETSPATEPAKLADQEQVSPGESFEYTIIVPASASLGEAADAGIVDELPVWVSFTGVSECSGGSCGYDEALHMVYMEDATLAPGETLTLRFNVAVVAEPSTAFPAAIVNCAEAHDGAVVHEVCTTTDLVTLEDGAATSARGPDRIG